MKKLIFILITTILLSSCGNSINMQEVFFKNRELFKKIEKPIKTNDIHIFEKGILVKDSIFDSTYLKDINQIFSKTPFNNVYIVDGDVFVGCKKQLTKLCFTTKNSDEIIEVPNFRGTLNYLLKNGKSETPPFALEVAPNWYIVKGIESL